MVWLGQRGWKLAVVMEWVVVRFMEAGWVGLGPCAWDASARSTPDLPVLVRLRCAAQEKRVRLLDLSGASAALCNASSWFVVWFLLLGSCSWRAGVRADRLLIVASLAAMSKVLVLRLSAAAQENAAEELEAGSL